MLPRRNRHCLDPESCRISNRCLNIDHSQCRIPPDPWKSRQTKVQQIILPVRIYMGTNTILCMLDVNTTAFNGTYTQVRGTQDQGCNPMYTWEQVPLNVMRLTSK